MFLLGYHEDFLKFSVFWITSMWSTRASKLQVLNITQMVGFLPSVANLLILHQLKIKILLQKSLLKYVLHLYYIKDCFKHPSKISSAIIDWRRANRLPIYPKEAVAILNWHCKGVWNMPTSWLGKGICTNYIFIQV